MESVTFALPSVGSADMSRQDQERLVVNQSAAIVISAWLEHATKLVELGVSEQDFVLRPAELPTLINNVQDALRGA